MYSEDAIIECTEAHVNEDEKDIDFQNDLEALEKKAPRNASARSAERNIDLKYSGRAAAPPGFIVTGAGSR
jgi:hypothetical protein